MMAHLNKKRRRLMIDVPELIHRQRRLGDDDDVPRELIHRIQLALPSKDAARTCILSKSWLHAWSTIPDIRFSPDSLNKNKNQRKYLSWIHRTLLRYHRYNLPITSLDLRFCVHNNAVARSVYKLISKIPTCLNELHLAIFLSTTSMTLPFHIFSSTPNLHTLSLERLSPRYGPSLGFSTATTPSIQCTNLRVLKLVQVRIPEFVLLILFNKCKLLQKIHIQFPVEFRVVKVTNLPCLDELVIYNINEFDNVFYVEDVPSLRSIYYTTSPPIFSRPGPVLFKLGTIHTLRDLTLDSVSMDDAFSSMIKSNFPFIESLTLGINSCSLEILDITSLTLRKLMLDFDLDYQIKVHVHAPNLLVYSHSTVVALPPSFLFSTNIPPERIQLGLMFDDSIDEEFIFNMRETLELSTKFNVVLYSNFGVDLPNFDIDVMRTILPFPATSVEQLTLMEHCNCELEENSLLFDVGFSVCHPTYVKTKNNSNLKLGNYLLNQLMVSYCEIRNPLNGRWEALTSSSLSLLDHTTSTLCDPPEFTEFKLSWCSP